MIALIIFSWFDGLYTSMSLWNVLLHYLDWILGLLREWTVTRADKLTQASLPRLGEMSRGSPRPFHVRGRSGDQLNFEQASVSLRRGESRLSENAQRPLFLCVELSPRRRELAWVRDPLAWARPFSLSEELGESAFWFDVFPCSWMFGM